ncbi:hypothetical protein Sipo8835_00110 [Streptomyces ipomoeae]|uniref:Uncharacterized protein n=1 Tax=Streptomyces ipomoeae TaxID=103232 RepID=A0AAE8W839_9ACTN|nr:DUF4175 domain-containing protein [Streptomyces ipomoeae]TQE40249.1 hypothetical protein Sipo8835_00110 [Streptomyces ipomoeae]
MKPILFGAVLALLWLAFGLPLATPFGGVANLVQPVTVAFVLGFAASRFVSVRLTDAKGWTR